MDCGPIKNTAGAGSNVRIRCRWGLTLLGQSDPQYQPVVEEMYHRTQRNPMICN